jgi:hypothetical protein
VSFWPNNSALQQEKSMQLSRLIPLVLIAGMSSVAGCSSLGVKPWQRDVLAREEMRLDSDPLDAAIDDHLYFSKEASSGGRSFAGGGCGCN